jgi:bifunctional oligoribonuclease and PAP phosphatase NrnA
MSIDWRPLVDLVRKHNRFVLTTHMRPDCDAVGSCVALAEALRTLGKKVQVVIGDPVPPHIAFMDPHNEVAVLGRDVQAEALKPDVLIVLDTSAWSQLGPMADVLKQTAARKVVIDHHVSFDDLETEDFKDPEAEATGRLVLEAIKALGVAVTPTMASAMFTAIATDTGWFRFSSVNEATFAAAAELVQAGANPKGVFSVLYEQNSMPRLLLHGRILAHAHEELGGRLVYSAATDADFAATGALQTDTEDVVNRLLSAAGAEVAVLFQEQDGQDIKASLRSRGTTDVRQIAEQFGGGGHTAAAGVRYEGTLAQAQQAVLDAVRKVLG